MQQQSEQNLNQSKVLYIIWLALMASVIIYAYVCSIVAKPHEGFIRDDELIKNLQLAFGIISLVIAGGLPILKKKLLSNAQNLQARVNMQPVPVPVEKTFIPQIITWALCESIAIYGFVLAIIGKDFTLFIPFGTAAIILMLYHRPIRD